MRPISTNESMSKKNLVIVESPAKAKTIEKFLGSEYHVLSSQGHIRDIEGVGKNSMGIDFEHDYAPHYVQDPAKRALIKTLQSESQAAETVWLASDEDREGEAIAWHLKEVLALPDNKTKRIVFHEITKDAITEAIEHPRDIDYNLVNAQQARRVIDRIVGFELSPVLWKKIAIGLSAGRVQSVAVRLIVEKEREIETFHSTAQYRINAEFATAETNLKTELNKRFATKEEALLFLESLKDATFEVASIQTKPSHRSPAPPFTTSSLQQEAARKLKFSVSKTMRLAQSLYEAGHITYMRTDSVNLSSLAIGTAKQEIISQFGEKYHHARQFHTTSKGAQEAHEAIRPTYISKHKAGNNADEQHLYELIWKRTISSQMADAEVENTTINVTISNSDKLFVATGEVVLFDGFMRAYVQSKDEVEEEVQALPKLANHTPLALTTATGIEQFSKPPYRYTEASLVKKMEELGIGRPSTYATIIETIIARKYVERGSVSGTKREYHVLTLKGNKVQEKLKTEMAGADSQKLLPTDLGRMTNDFLVAQFPAILNYDFTAREEAKFDEVAEGHANWVQTVDEFYKAFHPLLEHVEKGKLQGRELGLDPKTGEPVIAKITKTGPCIQIGDSAKDKPRFASLDKGQSIYTITLEEALRLFESHYPRVLGNSDGEEVSIGNGRFGFYVRRGNVFASLPKGLDPQTVTLETALELLDKKDAPAQPIADFGSIKVMPGRYGAYIKTDTGNYKLPKGTKPETLTQEACEAIIAASEPTNKGAKRTFRAKKA